MTNHDQNTTFPAEKTSNLGVYLLTILTALWIVFLSAIDLFSSWILEQTLVQASAILVDSRWMTHLMITSLIFLACLLGALLVKHVRVKEILTLWSIGAIFSLLTTPSRLLFFSSQNETVFLQLWAVLLIMLLWRVFKKRRPNRGASGTPGLIPGWVFFLACLMCLPWVLWGALGSSLDTALVIILASILAAVMIDIMASYSRLNSLAPGTQNSLRDVIFDGLVYTVFLVMITSALGVNGSQEILVFILPISAWLVALSIHLGKSNPFKAKLAGALFLGLAVALPLAFFDMDELLMLFGGEGEISMWANKAAFTTFMGVLVYVILAVVSFSTLKRFVIHKGINLFLALTGLSGVLLSYFLLGQPGFFGDHLFVVLSQQADLSGVSSDLDYQAKRNQVYRELVRVAEDTQAPLLDHLDDMKIKYTPYYLLNAVEVEGGKWLKWRLQQHPSVDRILESPQLRPLPQKTVLLPEQTTSIPADATWNLAMIGADRVKENLKITGSGIIIGQTDSGVDGKHAELMNSYRGANSGDDYNWFDPWNRSAFPVDPAGHGTLTLGVVMGENIGVAPDAEWIGCANLARNLGNPAYYLDCMQFMLAPFPQDGDPFKEGDPSLGAMIINNSWGCPEGEGCDAQIFASVVDALKQAGIFMSVSAGNSGIFGCSTISDPPAIYPDVFTVGSIDMNGELSDFSSLGPVTVGGSNNHKPDLLAPGDDIFSSYPGGGYSYVSGTSFAAPHVSGVVALMWSANPDLIGDVEKTSQILRNSTKPYNGNAPTCGEPNDAVGFGILDAYQAVVTAMSEVQPLKTSNQ